MKIKEITETQKAEIERLLKRKGRLFGVDYENLSNEEAEQTIRHLKGLRNKSLN